MGTTRRHVLTRAPGAGVALVLAGCGAPADGEDGGADPPDDDEDGGDGGADPPDVARFRETITTELAVSLQRLERQDRTVVLRYRSNHESETEQWGYEIGFVCGRFGRLVDDGWDVDTLDGTVTGSEGRTLTWDLSADTAAAFVRDEITAEEFVTEIFDSMREA